jgi:hypothetical protein
MNDSTPYALHDIPIGIEPPATSTRPTPWAASTCQPSDTGGLRPSARNCSGLRSTDQQWRFSIIYIVGSYLAARLSQIGSSTPTPPPKRELDWIEGRIVAIEYCWTEGRIERAAEFAAEFVRLKPDIIFSRGVDFC